MKLDFGPLLHVTPTDVLFLCHVPLNTSCGSDAKEETWHEEPMVLPQAQTQKIQVRRGWKWTNLIEKIAFRLRKDTHCTAGSSSIQKVENLAQFSRFISGVCILPLSFQLDKITRDQWRWELELSVSLLCLQSPKAKYISRWAGSWSKKFSA